MVGRGRTTKTLPPDILISCQMCKRVGSSGAVTVYLLGNHVFLECIRSVLPEEDSPAQTVCMAASSALNRISWTQSRYYLCQIREKCKLSERLHSPGGLPFTASGPKDNHGCNKKLAGWIIDTDMQSMYAHPCTDTDTVPHKQTVIQRDSWTKLW